MEHIKEFVKAYDEAFNKFFEAPEPLQYFVMLKPGPEADTAHDQHKDGVHILCPNITTSSDIQFAIRGYLLQNNVIERIFGPTGNTEEAAKCLDKSVIKDNNWFLYGASKPNKTYYKLEAVFQDMESLDIAQWSPQELMKLLSIRHGHDNPTGLTMKDEAEPEWIQLLQRYGKGKHWVKTKTPTLTAQAGGVVPPLALQDDMIQVSGLSVRCDPPQAEIKLAYKLIDQCFNPEKRVGSYHEWVHTGLLLHNITNTEDSFKAWVSLSRKIPKYQGDSDASYKAKWLQLPSEAAASSRGVKPLTIATVHHYAKEDNSVKYREIMDRAHVDFAILNYSGTHVSVADLILDMYQHEFRCTPLKKGATAAAMDWYQYEGHTWKNLKSAMKLRERLSNQVRGKYVAASGEIGKLWNDANTEEEKNRLDDKRKKIIKLESSLQTSGFKDCVMKEITEKFYDEDFLQHMNQNATTVGFSNGVLELRHVGDDGQPHVHFRPGQPDDCISFQMGRGMVGLDAIPFLEGHLAYNPGAQNQPLEYLEIMSFFKKIYPDPVLREYCLTLYAACLEGANREQKFYILTGVGSNGKSKIVELLSKTFGEYQESMGTTAITRKRPDSGAANPDLVVLKCKRFVSMSEPDEGEKINTASMKQLSGEDVVKARALFQDQDQFVIMARIFMLCNDLPPVSSTDGGTWRRLRVIPHVARFIDVEATPDPTNHVYHKDLMLDGKIAKWRPYFASILVWYYEHRYLRGGLKEPDQVMAASKKYKEENDAFAAFCQDCLVKEAGSELRANDVLIRYKEWNKYNPGKKIMTKPALLQKLTDIYGAIDGGKIFVGVRLMEEGEDISGNYV
jgi:P4 family phage/plasmid primase-like protien